MDSLSFVYHPTFDRTAEGVLTDEQMIAVEEMLMADPRRGDVIQDTGGARKLRAAMPGRGKSGGARLIYIYIEIGAALHSCSAIRRMSKGTSTRSRSRSSEGSSRQSSRSTHHE